MSPVLFFPATCELCGHWIPQHAGNCPRNGVHPSQWSSSPTDIDPENELSYYRHALNLEFLKPRPIQDIDYSTGHHSFSDNRNTFE
ncbi:hypothetical protein BC941DRAFT_354954 [Chlamydoabsidia padenii]|nr:hypothetical protein BC941DRAFT_354954 [Chlamydoabsidia padenii]